MKKRVLILTVAAILFTSGTALAHGHHGRHYGNRQGAWDGWNGGYFCPGPYQGPYGQQREQQREWFAERHRNIRQQMPQHMRDKLDESRKIIIELQTEMNKTPLNKTKVLSLRGQSEKLRKEVSDWYFTQWLNNPQTPVPAPEKK